MGDVNFTPTTYTSGMVVTAAELTADVNNSWTNIQSAWTQFIPTLTNITKGNGTTICTYRRVGKWITVRFLFTAGSTTTYSAGALAVSLPVTPHTDYTGSGGNWAVGSAMVNPLGSNRLGATCVITGTGVLNFLTDSASSSALVQNTAPATWGTSGVLSFVVAYEAA